MHEVTTIGLDLAKNVFQAHGVDAPGRVVLRRKLRRDEVARFFAALSPVTVGMEACGSAHHWARVLERLGHRPPAYVKPYVKRGKTDAADAEAICEAVTRPTMRFVPVKTEAQQAVGVQLKVRQLLVQQRTRIVNAILYLTYRSATGGFGPWGANPMAQPILTAAHLQNEEAAFAFLEARVWPDGPVCPHCGTGQARIRKLSGKTTRIGLWKCYACMKPFTVKVGTVFESSHVPLHLWLQAVHLLCSSKKGISGNQLHRTLGVTLKTAWFMSRRIRGAMTTVGVEPMGGDGSVVEIDETFIGKKEGVPVRRGCARKHAVMALVERGKSARSFHVSGTAAADLLPIIKAYVSSGPHIMTDEAGQYAHPGKHFAKHEFVRHGAGEYVRDDVHTNTLEGFHSVFKRGMKGVYQHCSERHLHRYVTEFDFRYNNRIKLGVDDVERTDRALKGAAGKRLTYRTPHRQMSSHAST